MAVDEFAVFFVWSEFYIMKTIKNTQKRGLTLIEVVVAATVLVVASMGAIGYRYYCVLDERKADVQLTAARLGLMFMETWRGAGGRAPTDPYNIYNPLNLSVPASGLQVNAAGGPGVPSGFNSFGSYCAVADGANYYTTLSYQDDAANGLRELSIVVAWPQDYPTGKYSDSNRSVKLATKVGLP